MWEDEKPRIGVNKKRSTPEEHTSENTIKESSGQIQQHNHKPKETRMPEDPRILTHPSKDRSPILKTIEHKPRKRGKVGLRPRKRRIQIKYPSPPHSML